MLKALRLSRRTKSPSETASLLYIIAKREQEEIKKRERAERRERKYNMGKGNPDVDAADGQLSEVSEDEWGQIVIKKRIDRQIEEGVFGVDE